MKLFNCFVLTVLLHSACSSPEHGDCKATENNSGNKNEIEPLKLSPGEKLSLFNGKDLQNWKSTQFGGQGEVTVKEGKITFDYGNPMTGITWDGGALPVLDYEIELEAVKLDGNDFFVGLTFPYKDSHLTLILGGWGGVVCGISSFNHVDASENETSFVEKFEKNKWYKVAVQVREDQISVFIDGKKVIDTIVDGRKVHTRPEVDPSKPLGVCSFETRVSYRKISLRKLK